MLAALDGWNLLALLRPTGLPRRAALGQLARQVERA